MTKWILAVTSGAAAISLLGCADADYPTCSSSPIRPPGGLCSAYYYQTDYGAGGATTQAMTDCEINSQRLGGNVVAFHTLSHGIGLRWLDTNTLEVAVPPGVKLEDRRTNDIYLGHRLNYKYRDLLPDELEFHGCSPKRLSGST